jgi:transmembrane sensor
MKHRSTGKERIAAEAVEWFLQFHNADGRQADRAAFAEWLTCSPAHVEEFLDVSGTWADVSRLNAGDYSTEMLIAAARDDRAHDKVVQLIPVQTAATSSISRGAPRRRPRRLPVRIAASLLAGMAVWGGYLLAHRPIEYTTAVGEQRSVSLPDGSVVFLNTNSEVRVRFGKTARDIALLRGEARFQVAKNPQRPFIVTTAEATVRAIGTVFNVATDKESTQVAVIEGRIELRDLVANDASPEARPQGAPDHDGASESQTRQNSHVELAAGQRAAVTAHGIEPDVGPSIEYVNAWTERRLVFRDKTVAEVVRQFNRYRQQPMVVDDPRLAGLRISGSFDPSDPDTLIAYLGSVEAVQVLTSSDGSVHLARGSQ